MKFRRKLFVTDYCLTPFERIERAGILCENGKIIAVGGASAFEEEGGLEVIELRDCYAVPGFVDSHIHGAGGFDSTIAHHIRDKFTEMTHILASHGVTSFLPTTVSAPNDEMLDAIRVLADLIEVPHEGAEPIGIHVEGPFLNRKKHGSQNEAYIKNVDLGFAREIIEEGRGKVKIMTIAPELKNSVKLIELLVENNIVVSMGHSLANEEDVLRAVEAGATRCTHLFNGMPALHQRQATLPTVALTDDRIAIELILDGSHLHPKMIDLACRIKPKDKLIGVSDAIQGAGLKDGFYCLGGAQIQVFNGKSLTEDGILAGTTLTLEKGWHHLVTYSHMTITDAAACFSLNPAQNLNLFDRGEIKPKRRADIVFFDKETNRVRMTVVKGKVVYKSENNNQDD
jgi:N-acetylglucosamine-6-phosphate deacetylase